MKRFMVLTFAVLAIGSGVTANPSGRAAVQLLSGESVEVEGERARPLYLKFWASWCGQCLAQMPHLQAIHEVHGENVDVIAANFGLNDTVEQILETRRRFGMSMPIGHDELGELSRSLKVTVVPYSIIVDREGSIAHRGWGDKGVDEKIAELIRDQP